MPSFITANYHTNEPRASQARGAGELGNAFAIYALSRALTAAGVARGTTATKAKIVNTLQFSIGGAQFSKAATDDFWTLSGTTVQASSWQKYLLLIDSSGNASMQEGTVPDLGCWRVVGQPLPSLVVGAVHRDRGHHQGGGGCPHHRDRCDAHVRARHHRAERDGHHRNIRGRRRSVDSPAHGERDGSRRRERRLITRVCVRA